jgi:hypothetical protein
MHSHLEPMHTTGSHKSFTGVTLRLIFPLAENNNARYYLESASQDQCIIDGVGKVVASNGDSVRVRIRITEPRNYIEILN